MLNRRTSSFYERKDNKSSELKMTHQATANRYHYQHTWCPALQRIFVFRKDVRTDTTCENNDHLFGRGLVGQYFDTHGK